MPLFPFSRSRALAAGTDLFYKFPAAPKREPSSDSRFSVSTIHDISFLKQISPLLALVMVMASNGFAQWPENLVVEGIPPITPELKQSVASYLEFRAASLQSWHPTRRAILITTRFADASQLHLVKMPGGARRQLTFLPEPVGGGSFQPKSGASIVFSQDFGGGEFYQLYRHNLADGKNTLLTDGKSRNTGLQWSRSGKQFVHTSTQRTGRDNDIWLADPADPSRRRLLHEVTGGGWSVQDWSHDEAKLLLREYVSINESYLYLLDIETGTRQPITEKGVAKAAFGQARFAADDNSIFASTDQGSEFLRLVEINLKSKTQRVLTADISWDVDEFEITSDGKTIAFITNEGGLGVLHLLEAKTGRKLPVPKLPAGIPGGLLWHENGRDLGFTFTSAKSPSDAYSLDIKSGALSRWTESETGGLNTDNFVEPELVKLKSFDGLPISAFLYRPDPVKFPGKRPVIVSIHGGPESQARPAFLARNNYYVNELGIALILPNVRGSSGYGKTFLTLDNGFKREESVQDIGTLIEWLKKDSRIDATRIAVMGGSYGGYMVLASMARYNDQLRCGVDVVGISNFLTFLKNTQDYRRDLRRAEYGDERDEKMRAFLEQISPTAIVAKLKKPLFVVQGKNDPRVPVTESEQMVKAIRENGGTVWYLMAKDEGHGFAKKRNADLQFLATIGFLQEHLLQ